ncbi:UNVERIFIED_CONTAM: hypothetical protein GTU68_039115 [Idotea baltica]|nr:hypothetical protein [Idotea baltica]
MSNYHRFGNWQNNWW